jgi:hypothetical protein
MCLQKIGLFPHGFEGPNSNQYPHNANHHEQNSSPIGNPIKRISVRIPLNRDVCGGEFADHYGAFIVLCFFAVGIVLELLAIAVFFNKGNSRLGWILDALSLFFWILGGLISPMGRLPWDWWRTPKGCQDSSEHHQSFQHNSAIVPMGAELVNSKLGHYRGF